MNRLLVRVTAANLLLLAVFVYGAALFFVSPEQYYLHIQEDQYLEWASFWAFVIAAIVSVYRVRLRWQNWFFFAVALFCLLVAMEEISWGQRLLGYRPPPWFLAENYQQELNLHNLLATSLRKAGLIAVIAVFGLVLPLLGHWRISSRWLRRFAIPALPISLSPAYAGILLMYLIYPWTHTGEWVELVLGLAFCVSMLATREKAHTLGDWFKWTMFAEVLAFTGGVVTAAIVAQTDPDPRYVDAATTEVAALADDIWKLNLPTRCGTHKRVHTLVRRAGLESMFAGGFAQLQKMGLPAERAVFFLDPWELPYWIRHNCTPHQSPTVFVYSFGPNRRRDSTREQLLPDDVGRYVFGGQN